MTELSSYATDTLREDEEFVLSRHVWIAQELYGRMAEDTIGKVTHDLLKTIFPAPHEEITAEAMRAGRWEGELVTDQKGRQAHCGS